MPRKRNGVARDDATPKMFCCPAERQKDNTHALTVQALRTSFLARRFGLQPEMAAAVAALAFETVRTR